MQVWLDGARAATQMDRPDRPLRCLLVSFCQPANGSFSVVKAGCRGACRLAPANFWTCSGLPPGLCTRKGASGARWAGAAAPGKLQEAVLALHNEA